MRNLQGMERKWARCRADGQAARALCAPAFNS